MAELTAERKATAKLVMRHLMKRDIRKHLKAHGLAPQAPVVACEWGSPVGEVLGMLRAQDGAEHVIILIRRADEILTLFATTGDTPEGSVGVPVSEMHGNSTIGLVYDSLQMARFTVNDPSLPPRVNSRLGQYDLVTA